MNTPFNPEDAPNGYVAMPYAAEVDGCAICAFYINRSCLTANCLAENRADHQAAYFQVRTSPPRSRTFTDPQEGEFYDKNDLAEALYPGVTVDTALPQDWVDSCQNCGFNPVPHVVWAYPKEASIFGEPRPVTLTGVLGLARLTMRLG